MTKCTNAILIFLVFAGFGLCGNAALAADWDHVHLVASDTKAVAEWYAEHFDGKVVKSGQYDAVKFGDYLLKVTKGGDDVEGSVGSALDHIAFSVEELWPKVGELQEAGAKRLSPSRRATTVRLIDPWGTKIEVLVGEAGPGFHHAHIRSPKPLDALKWYSKVFDGGDIVKFRGASHFPSLRFGDVWLICQTAQEAVTPSEGRSIDHLSWSVPDFEGTVEKLKADGVKFLVEPVKSGRHMVAFIEGPDGVKIELVGK